MKNLFKDAYNPVYFDGFIFDLSLLTIYYSINYRHGFLVLKNIKEETEVIYVLDVEKENVFFLGWGNEIQV